MRPAIMWGVESATKVPDKFERAGFHAVKSEFVNAPIIAELPMAYDPVNHTYMPRGEVVGHAFQDGLQLKQEFHD